MIRLSLLLFLAQPAPGSTAPTQLEAAVDDALVVDRDAAIANLEQALEARDPALALASGASELELRARVILIRLYLAQHDQAAAELAIDELIDVAREQLPPVSEYGAEITRLYEARRQARHAQGRASLIIDCARPCEVVIDGRLSPEGHERLLLGSHEVWLRMLDGQRWERRELELREAEATVRYEYTAPVPEPDEPVDVAPPRVDAPIDRPTSASTSARGKRTLPRGVEIAGLVAGVGLTVAGSVLLGYHNRCSETGEKADEYMDPQVCGDVYRNAASGAALLAAGVGSLLAAGVLLTVDEVRVGRRKAQRVMVGVTLAF